LNIVLSGGLAVGMILTSLIQGYRDNLMNVLFGKILARLVLLSYYTVRTFGEASTPLSFRSVEPLSLNTRLLQGLIKLKTKAAKFFFC
jgi:hypothetical protein